MEGGAMNAANTKRDKIIDDLLLRYPRGKTRKLKKDDYEIDSNYNYERCTYVNTVIPGATSEAWGWSKEAFFDLNLHSEGAVERYLKTRFFEDEITQRGGYGSKRATLTRQTRRIWERIKLSIQQVKSDGLEGVYRVSTTGYGSSSLGHIFSSTKDKAVNIAAVMFAHLINDDDRRYGSNGINAELVSRKNIKSAVSRNATFFKKIEDNTADQRKRIVQIEKEIAQAQMKLATMMQLQDMLLEAANED
jgi:hypothetical protein